MRLQVTKLSAPSRQLSVLLGLALSLPATAQMSPGTREAILSLPAITAPAYDNKKTLLYMKAATITAIGGDRKFRLFYVRPDLSFGVQYTYDVVLNFTASDVRGNQRPIPDGYYQLTMASFLKDASDVNNPSRVKPGETLSDRFVTRSPPMYVRVTAGEAHAQVPLRFDNPTYAAIDNTLYVEMIPLADCKPGQPKNLCLVFDANGKLDEKRSPLRARDDVYPYLLDMDFLPYQKANSGKMAQDISKFSTEISKVGLANFSMRALADRIRAELAAGRRPLSPARYAAKNNLTMLDLNDPGLAASSRRWLRGVGLTDVIRSALYSTETGPIRSTEVARTLQNVFCQYVADQVMSDRNLIPMGGLASAARQELDNQIALCQQGIGVDVYLRRVQHVGQVSTNLLQRETNGLYRYVLMNNFTTNRSHEESSTQTFSFKPFSALIKALDPVGLIPFDYSQNISIGNTRSTSQSAGTSMQEYMDVNTVVLTIPTTNTQVCLDVTMTTRDGSPLIDRRKGSRQGYYLCDGVQPKMDVHEFYMHAFSHMNDSSLGDAHDRLTQVFNKALRGDTNLAAFYYSTRKALNPEQDEKLPSWYSAYAAKYFADAPLPQAGLVIAPIVANRNPVPSYFDMLILNPAQNEQFSPSAHRQTFTSHP